MPDDTYAPLLRVGLDNSPSTGDADAVQPADVLPPQAKAAMVLEARGDLLDAERGLREIEMLEKRGVAGAGTLEGVSCFSTDNPCSLFLPSSHRLTAELVALGPALDPGRAQLQARRHALASTRRDVAALVERYTEFVCPSVIRSR